MKITARRKFGMYNNNEGWTVFFIVMCMVLAIIDGLWLIDILGHFLGWKAIDGFLIRYTLFVIVSTAAYLLAFFKINLYE